MLILPLPLMLKLLISKVPPSWGEVSDTISVIPDPVAAKPNAVCEPLIIPKKECWSAL